MKIEINGLHFSAAITSIILWLAWLPLWPSLFVFILGQIAATALTSIINLITEAASHDE